jgi:hypothetical protein
MMHAACKGFATKCGALRVFSIDDDDDDGLQHMASGGHQHQRTTPVKALQTGRAGGHSQL